MKGKNYFFTSRLVCFNETFASMANCMDTCVLWHEAISGRSANDVASSFFKIIKRNSPPLNHYIFWADNCGPQNKNWILYSALLQLVNSVSGPQSITLRYLEKGHTFMRCDSIHGLIGKRLKHTSEVLDYEDLLRLISSSKQDIAVAPLSAIDFFQFPSFKTRNTGLPKLRGLKEVHFQKGSPNLMYKRDLDARAYFIRKFAMLEIPGLPLSSGNIRGINVAKKAAICAQLVPQMPVDKRRFWLDLPESSVTDLCEEVQ